MVDFRFSLVVSTGGSYDFADGHGSSSCSVSCEGIDLT